MKKMACIVCLCILIFCLCSCAQSAGSSSAENSTTSKVTDKTNSTQSTSAMTTSATTATTTSKSNPTDYKVYIDEDAFCAAANKVGIEKDDSVQSRDNVCSKYIKYSNSDVWFIYGQYYEKSKDGTPGSEAAMNEFSECYDNFNDLLNSKKFVGSYDQYTSDNFGYLVMDGQIKTGSHLRFFRFDKDNDTTEDLDCYVFLYVNDGVFIEARTLIANKQNINQIETFLKELGLPTV